MKIILLIILLIPVAVFQGFIILDVIKSSKGKRPGRAAQTRTYGYGYRNEDMQKSHLKVVKRSIN